MPEVRYTRAPGAPEGRNLDSWRLPSSSALREAASWRRGARLPYRVHMSRRHNDFHRRPRHGAQGAHAHERIPLTPEGVPAAAPEAVPVSPAVFVSEDSRARYPWLPPRVIAWSVWRGPDRARVRIDESGNAAELGAGRILPRVA